jgi:hypothetical protein
MGTRQGLLCLSLEMPEDGQDIQPHQPNYRIPKHPEKTSFPRNDRLNPQESAPPHRKPRAGLPKNTALPQRSRRDPLQIHQVVRGSTTRMRLWPPHIGRSSGNTW